MTTILADVINKHAMVVHSQVRWVTADPQVRRRFEHAAQSRAVLFVESPHYLDDRCAPSLDCAMAHPGVHRVVPHLPALYRANEAASLLATRTLLVELLGVTGSLAHRFDHPIHWFDSPCSAPMMLGAFDECLVVYDPRDTPAMPRAAYTEWRRREQLLRARADVILSGEHSSNDAVLQFIDQHIRANRRSGRAGTHGYVPRHRLSAVAR